MAQVDDEIGEYMAKSMQRQTQAKKDWNTAMHGRSCICLSDTRKDIQPLTVGAQWRCGTAIVSVITVYVIPAFLAHEEWAWHHVLTIITKIGSPICIWVKEVLHDSSPMINDWRLEQYTIDYRSKKVHKFEWKWRRPPNLRDPPISLKEGQRDPGASWTRT